MRTRALAAAALIVLAACGGGGGDTPKLHAVVSIFPLAEVARAVGGDRVTVRTLTPPGTSGHAGPEEPRLGQAHLFLYVGGDFDPEMTALGARVDGATDVLVALDATDGDPHVWLDPSLMVRLTSTVEQELARLDPDHADDYRERADRFQAELTALDRDYRRGLADCPRNIVVTNHAAFQHLSRYPIELEPVVENVQDGPSPERIAALRTLIADGGITTLFTEPALEPLRAGELPIDTLAAATGRPRAILDPIEGTLEGAPARSYVARMRANLRVLRTALGCR